MSQVSFHTSWKHQNSSVSLMLLRGYGKRPVAWNGLIWYSNFQSILWNIVPKEFHETWTTFMKYFYFGVYTLCFIPHASQSIWMRPYRKSNLAITLIFTIHCSTRFSFLQIIFCLLSSSISRKMTREVVLCEKVFHWTNFLAFESQKPFLLKCFRKKLKSSLVGF